MLLRLYLVDVLGFFLPLAGLVRRIGAIVSGLGHSNT